MNGSIRPTKRGGRIIHCVTEWGEFNAEWDADGKLVSESATIKTPSTGLGDTIAKVTDKLGIPKCGGCKRRQKKLNKLMPYDNADPK